MKARQPPTSVKRGATIIYTVVALIPLMAIIAFAVDIGRGRSAKFELQGAADAAARHAATGLSTSLQTAINNAVAAAGENKAEWSSVVLNQDEDIEFGIWDAATRNFSKLTGSARAGATAVRVTARRTAARGNAIPAVFGQAFGRRTMDVTAVAVAARGTVITPVIGAKSCLWLAGMPTGSVVPKYAENTQNSTAPNCSPPQITGIPIVAGVQLSFRQTAGETGDATLGDDSMGLDGSAAHMATQRSENGINATTAPRGALMGIFLNNNAPNTTAAAGTLDFSTLDSRNRDTYSPGLKQVFFIGDGVTDANVLQKFTVPTGATRLYLGVMDEKGWWWDNTGSINTTMLDGKLRLVK